MARVTLCLIVLWACPVVAGDTATLVGTVNDEQRQPLTGAKVFISTAGPRYGYNPLCPSCYIDCGKSAVTDADGKYRIEGLDPDLVFGILAIAPSHRTKIMRRVDPSDGAAHLFLEKHSIEKLGPNQVVQGRVVGADGLPVAGATQRRELSRCSGCNKSRFSKQIKAPFR